MASKIWGQAVRIKKLKCLGWTPNVKYEYEMKKKLAVPVVSAETRANLARSENGDEVNVSIAVVDGKDKFKEKEVAIRRNATEQDIVDARFGAAVTGKHEQARKDEFPRNANGCQLIDGKGTDIRTIVPNMKIYAAIVEGAESSSDVNVCATFSGIGPDNGITRLGHRPGIDRNTDRTTILPMWKRKMLSTKEDWRARVEGLYGADPDLSLASSTSRTLFSSELQSPTQAKAVPSSTQSWSELERSN
jgi:hypothetical protein